MIKVIAFFKAKPGLSRDAFIDHYENIHVPLIRQLAAPFSNYRRNYLPAETFGQDGVFSYNCVTEIFFPDKTAYDAFLESLSKPDVQAQVAADEDKFLDRAATRFFMAEERS